MKALLQHNAACPAMLIQKNGKGYVRMGKKTLVKEFGVWDC